MSISKPKTVTEKIQNEREDLEALSESSLPVSDLAKTLLEVVEE
jgi:hypothetical protein